MATVIPFLRSSTAFEPETTQAMAEAFEEVCRALRLAETATLERETVASKIIDLARRGERNSARLIEWALRDTRFISASVVPPTLTA